MSQVTLDNLRIRSRNRADMTDSQFVDNAELDIYINNALGELYDILVQTQENENFLDGYEFTTVAGQSRYDMPADLHKFHGLDLQDDDSKFHELTRFNHSDRNLYKNSTAFIVNGIPRHRYRIRHGHLDILPAPEKARTALLHYIPEITKLVSSSDKVDHSIPEAWLEFVELGAAIKMLDKEESDSAALRADKQLVSQRILTVSRDRDAAKPEPTPDGNNSLFNLRIQCRYRAGGLEELITDREMNTYINASVTELHDLMIKAYGNDYFLDGYEITTVSGKKDYDLPTNFYKLAKAEIQLGGERYMLQRYNLNEEAMFDNTSLFTRYGVPYFRYRLLNKNIRLLPEPTGTNNITLWYAPQATKLSNDWDTIDDAVITGWIEYIIVDVATKMLQKALALGTATVQPAINLLMGQKATLKQRVEEMAEARDWGTPDTVTDVSYTDSGYGDY